MKNLILVLLLFICVSVSNARIITVNNNPNSPGQFITIQEAIDAAAPGDTIYVHGSEKQYASANITKRLVLLGAGHNPDKEFPFQTRINSLSLDSISAISGASGSEIIGCYTTIRAEKDNIKNIKILRNQTIIIWAFGLLRMDHSQ